MTCSLYRYMYIYIIYIYMYLLYSISKSLYISIDIKWYQYISSYLREKKRFSQRGARAAPATCTTLLWIRALDFLMGAQIFGLTSRGKTMGDGKFACFQKGTTCFLGKVSGGNTADAGWNWMGDDSGNIMGKSIGNHRGKKKSWKKHCEILGKYIVETWEIQLFWNEANRIMVEKAWDAYNQQTGGYSGYNRIYSQLLPMQRIVRYILVFWYS